MTDDVPIDRALDFSYGVADAVQPGIRRLIANNPGPFTFHGTATYIVGADDLAIIDPGPIGDAHLEAILAATQGERISTILVTHTHIDHSPLAMALQQRTGAIIAGCAPFTPSDRRELGPGLDASHDRTYQPDRILEDGDIIAVGDVQFRAIATPGHSANHLAFELVGARTLFSGDHIMAWSTSVVAPPDGKMADYMRSLSRLTGDDYDVFWPGHGGPVREPRRFTRALLYHRRQRETAILARLGKGDRTIPDIVKAIYEGLDPMLHGAAGLSVLAHLDDLVTRGLVDCEGAPGPEAIFRPA